MQLLSWVLVGIIAGLFGGAFGVGGGGIMVPIFVIFFGLSQHQAQGTSLAVMVLPIFIFAVWKYYAAGNVNVKMAVFVALGFAVGAFISSHYVQGVSDVNLRRGFGIALIIIALKMIFVK